MVKTSKLEVAWDTLAYAALQRAYNHIKKDSLVSAERVRSEILKAINKLPEHPEKHPRDKFKKSNDGNYRAFEKYSYRVSYKLTEQQIIILRVRHVKQEPLEY
jgi:plasmid stabilization system protein ParE